MAEVILIIKSMRVVTSAVTAALHCHKQTPLCKVNAVIGFLCVSKKNSLNGFNTKRQILVLNSLS